jgi:hypothetical protein
MSYEDSPAQWKVTGWAEEDLYRAWREMIVSSIEPA